MAGSLWPSAINPATELAEQVVRGHRSGSARMFAETTKSFGDVNILVNNAGVYEFKPLETIDEEHFHKIFDLNVLGLLLTTKEAVTHMNGQGGSVINVSSIASKTPALNSSVYSATKGAVDVISRALALELAPRKIRVNSLLPGATDTEGVRAMQQGDDNGLFQALISRTPLGRVGTVEDIAKAALFLASEDSGWITGEELLVGGGIACNFRSKMYEFFCEVTKPFDPDLPASSLTPEDLQGLFRAAAKYGYWIGSPEENAAIGLSMK